MSCIPARHDESRAVHFSVSPSIRQYVAPYQEIVVFNAVGLPANQSEPGIFPGREMAG